LYYDHPPLLLHDDVYQCLVLLDLNQCPVHVVLPVLLVVVLALLVNLHTCEFSY
jgi:hypothetical protein